MQTKSKGKLIALILVSGFYILLGIATTTEEEGILAPLALETKLKAPFLTISNHDTIDYENCSLYLYDTLGDVYSLENHTLVAGQTDTLNMVIFRDSTMTGYPISQTPIQLEVSCTLPDGQQGFYSTIF